MKTDVIGEDWDWHKQKVVEYWQKLSDSEINTIDGDCQKLVKLLQSKYGYNQLRAEREVEIFFRASGKILAIG